MKILNRNAYQLCPPASLKIYNSFHVLKLKRYIPPQIGNQLPAKALLVEVEGDMEYEVEEIWIQDTNEEN
jgi:hypothetical protein